MKNHRTLWITWLLLATLSLFIWCKFTFPQLVFVNLRIDRHQALEIAEDYLKKTGFEPSQYKSATVFSLERRANQYLQKAISFVGLSEFVKEQNFDLFFWLVRFFNEHKTEEFRLTISSSTGEVIGFNHKIDQDAARPIIERDEARKQAEDFLTKKFKFDLNNYAIKGDIATNQDNRVDYAYSWMKKSVNIPWSSKENSGTGKIITGLTITGNEILSFSKNTFSVPEQFDRYLGEIQNTGDNLSTIVRFFYYILFIGAIFFVIVRRNHLIMHTTKHFYIGVATITYILSILSDLNNFQILLFNYSTTSAFIDYLWRFFINTMRGTLFYAVGIFLPAIAGELLHYENFKQSPQGSFQYYIRSTFFSRDVARLILLGYLVCCVMLGTQSLLTGVGQKYWGVWVQHNWMTQFSTSYWPFVMALTIGFSASLFEEIMYRMFAISWGKKIFKNTFAACVISSLIWGFAHSGYPVYPMWFRGIEVSCLGFFLSFVYLRYGIIPVIVGHFLFDVFWNTAGFLLGSSQSFYFYSSFLVLMLPLGFACIAFIINKKTDPKPMRWDLNKHQLFNLEVLKNYLKSHPEIMTKTPKDKLKSEIAAHGWDIAVVEEALGYPDDSDINRT